MLNRSDLGIGREKLGNGRQTGQLLVQLQTTRLTTLAVVFTGCSMQCRLQLMCIGEQTLGRANPALYGRHKVMGPDGRTPASLKQNDDYLKKTSILAPDGTPRSGVQIESDGTISDRNFKPGHVASLLVPAGVAVNSGLGLMTPFGGAEGYYAVNPSEEDPTKTANVIDEVLRNTSWVKLAICCHTMSSSKFDLT